jgi:putative ATP-binding cassette transporter
VSYPAGEFSSETVTAALERCGLEHLAGRLDDSERWDRVLSVGEQQRLAFGRVLLHRPDWVFMDEATSALDEEGQTMVLNLFVEELAGTTLVSIAHRPGVEAFHDRTLTLVMAVGGARLVTKRGKAVPAPVRTSDRRSLAAMVLRPFRATR